MLRIEKFKPDIFWKQCCSFGVVCVFICTGTCLLYFRFQALMKCLWDWLPMIISRLVHFSVILFIKALMFIALIIPLQCWTNTISATVSIYCSYHLFVSHIIVNTLKMICIIWHCQFQLWTQHILHVRISLEMLPGNLKWIWIGTFYNNVNMLHPPCGIFNWKIHYLLVNDITYTVTWSNVSNSLHRVT